MLNKIELSQEAYQDLEKLILSKIGKTSNHIISLTFNKSDSKVVIHHSAPENTFDLDLFIELTDEVFESYGYRLENNEHSLIFIDVAGDLQSFAMHAPTSLEESLDLGVLETVLESLEIPKEEYKSSIKRKYHEYLTRQVNTDTYPD